MTLTTLAAGPGIGIGHQIFGAVTYTGLSGLLAFGLLLGLRGNKRMQLTDDDRLGGFALVTGLVWMAAGSNWADFMQGVNSVPDGLVGSGSPMGNWGAGGVAALFLAITFLPDWGTKRFPPVAFALMAAPTLAEAGGVWAIPVNVVRLLVAMITGGAG
ncbi:hypothetical protein [Streptomyces sp. NBC_00198]|uniref:hypothetical protein n=1 Tax=Streptomyces sp. NBC_00198 TaxID=2975677 RepID=UPI002258D434|nr:hypothetical protein [Streptomyces sp. NBC_00198]MCX5285933.1 hypothetical protein [Streptomyces sp. NBC_00198]MCX5286242.1 hypothetical protein [Streptomyces sp. NBC_00198]